MITVYDIQLHVQSFITKVMSVGFKSVKINSLQKQWGVRSEVIQHKSKQTVSEI